MRQFVEIFTRTVAIFFMGWLLFAAILPGNWWLDVRSVQVSDAYVGEPPLMAIDRTIHHDFVGTYIVNVEQLQSNRRYSKVCSTVNTVNYSKDAALPQPATLDWWVWPGECSLGSGRYRIKTSWVIEDEWFPDKIIKVTTNSFTVRERAGAQSSSLTIPAPKD